MPDPRFFQRAGPFTLRELAALTGAELANASDENILIKDVAPLDRAQDAEISFLENRKYVSAFKSSAAQACIVNKAMAKQAPEGMALLLSNGPYKAYAQVASAFYPETVPVSGIHTSAVIDETAQIGADCAIGAGAVIGKDTKIGDRCTIEPNVVIGDGVTVGSDCVIGACASLSHCDIGKRVVIYTGVRIGQRGFGFAMDPAGHVKVPQLGRVIVGDDVEIGANSTVDRGAGPDTVIGRGSMIDNLVQIAHNVKIGEGCVIIAQVGISGSTVVEDYAALAGQAGVAGHLRIGKGAQVGAQAGVMRDVAPGERILGSPAVPAKQFFRQTALLDKLAKNKGS